MSDKGARDENPSRTCCLRGLYPQGPLVGRQTKLRAAAVDRSGRTRGARASGVCRHREVRLDVAAAARVGIELEAAVLGKPYVDLPLVRVEPARSREPGELDAYLPLIGVHARRAVEARHLDGPLVRVEFDVGLQVGDIDSRLVIVDLQPRGGRHLDRVAHERERPGLDVEDPEEPMLVMLHFVVVGLDFDGGASPGDPNLRPLDLLAAVPVIAVRLDERFYADLWLLPGRDRDGSLERVDGDPPIAVEGERAVNLLRVRSLRG